LIGQERKPIDSSLVKLYAEPPHQYKTIATVEARTILGFDEQHEINDAVAELKEQAADLGANGIISIKISFKAQGYESAKIVTGKAVYVINE